MRSLVDPADCRSSDPAECNSTLDEDGLMRLSRLRCNAYFASLNDHQQHAARTAATGSVSNSSNNQSQLKLHESGVAVALIADKDKEIMIIDKMIIIIRLTSSIHLRVCTILFAQLFGAETVA